MIRAAARACRSVWAVISRWISKKSARTEPLFSRDTLCWEECSYDLSCVGKALDEMCGVNQGPPILSCELLRVRGPQ